MGNLILHLGHLMVTSSRCSSSCLWSMSSLAKWAMKLHSTHLNRPQKCYMMAIQ